MVIGATGAVGIPLVRHLREGGHEVIGTSRSQERAEHLGTFGAHPIVLDALDAPGVHTAVAAARPEAIIYQATGLAGARILRSLDRPFAATNRLRTEGLDNVLAAARKVGVLDPSPPASAKETFAAMSHLDQAVTGAGGIALRYGAFYGPGDEGLARPVRKRQTPLVGDGRGVMSFVHLDDAAAATVLALDHAGPAIFNIVDDEPAPMSDWLPVLAEALGAKPPRHVPTWLARLIAGPGLTMLTEARGSSNAKARNQLDWQPRYPSWRQGFAAAYGERSDMTSRS
jgi:nucleoside-diphosphate-sugar epimerase